MNEVFSITRAMAASISLRIDRYWALRSTKGIFFPVAVVIGSSTLRKFGAPVWVWRSEAHRRTAVLAGPAGRLEDAHDPEAVGAIRDRRDTTAAAGDEVGR